MDKTSFVLFADTQEKMDVPPSPWPHTEIAINGLLWLCLSIGQFWIWSWLDYFITNLSHYRPSPTSSCVQCFHLCSNVMGRCKWFNPPVRSNTLSWMMVSWAVNTLPRHRFRGQVNTWRVLSSRLHRLTAKQHLHISSFHILNAHSSICSSFPFAVLIYASTLELKSGFGYVTLPFAAHAKAQHPLCCGQHPRCR